MKRSTSRTFVVVAGALGAMGGAGLLGACLLADPVPERPALASLRPAIVGGGVLPSAGQPLRELPEQFEVPVQVEDPGVAYPWRVFVDFDAVTNAELSQSGTLAGGRNSANLQVVRFSVDREALQAGCHRIEFIVARSFDSTRGANPAESDYVAWHYAPLGRAGCVPYDGGVDGAFPDAESFGDPP